MRWIKVKIQHMYLGCRMSRDYKVDLIDKGEVKLIHVYGGKLTTCLSTAEEVARLVL